jgi:5-methylcytosine-specific restriction endonuclease McrA
MKDTNTMAAGSGELTEDIAPWIDEGYNPWKRKARGKSTCVGSETRNRVKRQCGNQCLRCGSVKRVTIDHIVPKVLGGSNKRANLQALCTPCNLWKGARIIDYTNREELTRIQIMQAFR